MSRLILPTLPWYKLRALSTADTALTAFDHSDFPSSNTFDVSVLGKYCPQAKIAFYGTDAENEAGAYILYGVKKNGPVQELLAGVVTLGAQTLSVDPYSEADVTNGFWADTLTVTSGLLDNWDVIMESASDKIAMLQFPLFGVDYLFCELALDTAASIGAIITGEYNG